MIASVPIDKTNVEFVESAVTDGSLETGPAEVVEDPSETFVPEGADWRDAQYRGIGLGISFSGLNSMVVSYDYNSSPDTQWHLQFDLTGPLVQSWFSALQMTGIGAGMGNIAGSSSGNSLEISRSCF